MEGDGAAQRLNLLRSLHDLHDQYSKAKLVNVPSFFDLDDCVDLLNKRDPLFPEFYKIIDYLKHGKVPAEYNNEARKNFFTQKCSKYHLQETLKSQDIIKGFSLYWEKRTRKNLELRYVPVLISDIEVISLLCKLHFTGLDEHSSFNKIKLILLENYFWNSMVSDLEIFVSCCKKCNKSKYQEVTSQTKKETQTALPVPPKVPLERTKMSKSPDYFSKNENYQMETIVKDARTETVNKKMPSPVVKKVSEIRLEKNKSETTPERSSRVTKQNSITEMGEFQRNTSLLHQSIKDMQYSIMPAQCDDIVSINSLLKSNFVAEKKVSKSLSQEQIPRLMEYLENMYNSL